MPLSQQSEQLLAGLRQHLEDCDEANELLDLADTEGVEIEWTPGSGESLRGALRQLKQKRERG